MDKGAAVNWKVYKMKKQKNPKNQQKQNKSGEAVRESCDYHRVGNLDHETWNNVTLQEACGIWRQPQAQA